MAPHLLLVLTMKTYLDWSTYKDAGTGDAYANIPKQGGDALDEGPVDETTN